MKKTKKKKKLRLALNTGGEPVVVGMKKEDIDRRIAEWAAKYMPCQTTTTTSGKNCTK